MRLYPWVRRQMSHGVGGHASRRSK
jgi:hypothetical protein